MLVDQRVPLEHQAALGADIQLHEVLAAIRALKTGKSTSGVVAEVYKALRHELAPLMVLQFNAARKTGVLSELQRTGRVTLLFKKGDRLSAAQYRPVTVLSADFKALGLVLRPKRTTGG